MLVEISWVPPVANGHALALAAFAELQRFDVARFDWRPGVARAFVHAEPLPSALRALELSLRFAARDGSVRVRVLADADSASSTASPSE